MEEFWYYGATPPLSYLDIMVYIMDKAEKIIQVAAGLGGIYADAW